MRRLLGRQRFNWERIIADEGLVYAPTHLPDGSVMSYWQEGPYYDIDLAEIDEMERVANVLFAMCIEAGDYMIQHPDVMRKMGIPEWAFGQIIKTWNEEPAWGSVYGRFDIRFGGFNHPDASMRTPKLYEFNADTPTCLVEATWVQWCWLEQTGQGKDQWNAMSEKLVKAWTRNMALIEDKIGHKPVVHFTMSAEETSGEDRMNTLFLLETCQEAGYTVKSLFIENIKLDDDGRFYDEQGDHIDVIFKLYPWEFMVDQEFGRACFADMENIGKRASDGSYVGGTIWIEPPYKMLWSNKGLLPVLWSLFGNDPDKSKYLIPAWFDGEQPRDLKEYVRKPLLGREGANVIIYKDGEVRQEVPGEYGAEGFVVQAFAPPPAFESADQPMHPVCGVWIIDGDAAGLGIRESVGYVTDNLSFFTPHSIGDTDLAYTRRDITATSTTQAATPVSLPMYASFGDPTFGRIH